MVDLHHIPNIEDSKRLIRDFKIATGVAIGLPLMVHRNLPSIRFKDVLNARDLLAKEIRNLRKNTPVPNSALLKIVELNKKKYPNVFKKEFK